MAQEIKAPWQVRDLHPPLAGESADGFLARVAAAEFAVRTIDFTVLAGASFAHRAALSRQDAKGIAVMADCLKVDAGDLSRRCVVEPGARRRVSFFGASLDRLHVAMGVRRFAPASLDRSEHHRALWTLRPFPFCEETWQFLVERCSSCDAIQRWRWTNGIALCDRCAEPLNRAAADAVPTELRDRLAAAIGIAHPDPERRAQSLSLLPAELAGIGAAGLLDLLCAVAGVVDPSIRWNRSCRLIHPSAPAPATAAAVAQAWDVMKAWPSGFERLAGDRLGRREGRFGDGNDGATLDFLKLPERATLPTDVSLTIEDVRDRLRSNANQGIHIRSAAAHVGAAVKAISAARRRGEIATIFHLQANRPLPLLDRGSLEAMWGDPRVRYVQAANSLGITYRGVEELVVLGRLEPAANRPLGSSQAAVTAPSLDLLVALLRNGSGSVLKHPMPLRDAMRFAGARLKPWGLVIDAMLAGRVDYVLRDGEGALADLMEVDADAAIPIAREGSVESDRSFFAMMSKRDAVETLNLHPQRNHPILATWPSDHSAAQTVPVAEVLAIARRHVSASEIALRLSLPSNSVRRACREKGIRRLSDAGYDREAFDRAFPHS